MRKPRLVHWLAATGLFALGLWLLYAQYVRVQPPALTENPGFVPPMMADGTGKLKMPTEDERLAVFAQLDLTPEQIDKIREYEASHGPPSNPMALRGRIDALEGILTEEQKVRLRRAMGDRMENRMRERAKVLPPEEYAKFENKLERRREEMEKRVANGERPFMGPPPTERSTP